MPLVHLAERLGRAILFLFEDTIEMADIIEPAIIANLGYRLRRIDKRAHRVAQPHIYYII